ncbi:BMP family ABC transporter substrate-binding protein [Metamycoplasma alkalescens]|uniref:BMP family ABC transporter substrate-binding protein n=1 Tax=Metamycoplasma alkalescens TaxID=45363 RepID=UPI003D06245A
MKNKIFKKIGLIPIIIAFGTMPLIAARCNNSKYSHPKAPKQPIAQVEINEKFNLTPEQLKNFDKKIILITDSGDLNDKAFNQSSWEGLLHFADIQSKLSRDKYGALEIKDHKFDEVYNQALNKGYNIWLLSGFNHKDRIRSWIEKNIEEVKKNKIIFIAQDFSNKDANGIKGHSIYQEFDTKEASFSAGYAAAKFLSNEKDKKDRTFGTFGGRSEEAVTDFIEGFMKGVYWWNKDAAKDKKVYITSPEIDLSSGFDTGTQMDTVISKILSQNPKMVLPVAGQAVGVIIAKEEMKNKYVIGVDTDQAIAAQGNKKELFFTSITKSLGQAAYDAIAKVATSQEADLSTNPVNELGGFQFGVLDGFQFEGFEKKWVDITKTYIGDKTKKMLADEALAAGRKEFDKLNENEKKWLKSKKALFNDDTEFKNIQELLNKLAKELLLPKN